MRRLIAAAVLVAVVAASLPWLVGLYLQYRHQQLLDDLRGLGYRVPASEYRLGWLRSRVLTELAPPVVGDDGPSRLRLDLRVGHGPGVWRQHWPPALATAAGRATLLDAPRALPALVLVASLGVFGNLDATLRMPDVTYSGAVGRLHFVAVDAHVRVARDGRWGVQGSLESLEATDPDGRRVRLDALGWELAGDDPGGAVPFSRLALTLGGLRLDADGTRPSVELGGLEAGLSAAAADDELALALTGAVETLTVGQQGFAPSALDLSVAGLNPAAIAELRRRLAAMDRQTLSASQRGMVTGRVLMAALPRLLAGTPEARLRRLSVTTPQGRVAATADLRLAPPDAGAGAQEAGRTDPRVSPVGDDLPRALLARLGGDARLLVPQALVVSLVAAQQARRVRRELALHGEPVDTLPPNLAADVEAAAQAATATLLREGWLTAEQGRLLAELRLAGAALRINGKEVALNAWPAPAPGGRDRPAGSGEPPRQ
jgi:hypothetical protein